MPLATRYGGAEPDEAEDLPPGWSRRPVAALPPAGPAPAEPPTPPAASDRPPIPPVSDRPPPPSRSTPPRHGAGAAALAVAGLLIAAVLGLYLARAEVVSRWPEAASLYARLGLDVEVAADPTLPMAEGATAEGATAAIGADAAPVAAGPTIEDVRSRLLADGGVRQLLVSGRIANPSDRPVPLPDIRVTLLAEDGRDLGSRVVDLAGDELGAGEVRPFETAVEDPPAQARSLSLTVIGEGEEDEGAAIDG